MSEGPRMDGMSPIYDAPCLKYCPSQLFQGSSVLAPSPITHYKFSQRLASLTSSTLIPLHRQLTGPGIYPTTNHACPSSTPGQPHRSWQQHLTGNGDIDVSRSRHARCSAAVKSPHRKTSAFCQASFWFPASSARQKCMLYVLLSVSSPLIDFEMSRQVSHSVLSSCYFAIKQYFSHSYRGPGLRRRHVGFGKIYHGRHQ